MKCSTFAAGVMASVFLACALVAARSQVSIVPTGSVWQYFDGGSQPAGWQLLSFDDSGWSNGVAQLGFGDGDEATVVRQYPSAGVTNLAIYFRHKVNLPDPSAYSNLLVRLRRDDGAVVYLNEVEVFRSNMPGGPVTYDTLASTVTADDGTNFYANPVSTALLLNGDNLLAVEIHQSSSTSSDISFDLELQGNVRFQPPVVSLATPPDSGSFGGAHLILNATASDTDGTIGSVDFYAGGLLLGSDENAPYSFTNANIADGVYMLTAVATDSTGISSTSAPVTVTVVPRLIGSGSAWKYLDDGSDQGSAWTMPAYDDGGWLIGPGQLGFGDGDEGTLLNRTNSMGTTNITCYFRRTFNVADPAAVTNLVVRLLRDDGGVVYLNGVEVFRNNMPVGPVSFDTVAPGVASDDGATFHASPVSTSPLVAGQNLLAVEIHQSGITSSDLSFDLELRPNVIPTSPVVTLTAPTANSAYFGPTNVTLNATAGDLDDPVAAVAFYDGATLLGADSSDPYSLVASNLALGSHVLRAVATDGMGLSATSAPVTVKILRPPVLTTLIATGAVWKYLDIGVDQGAAWRAPGFDDSSWSTGTAKFGTNDPATTVIRITPININLTAYFRHSFNVANAASVTNLGFRVLHDDGVVAYLNGAEVFRMNMPTGEVAFSTAAPAAIGGTNENYYQPTNLLPAHLVSGLNVLAVELHQAQGTSDAGFDLGLVSIAIPVSGPPPLAIEFLALPEPTINLTWPGSGFILQQAQTLGGFSDIPGATSPYPVPATGSGRFYRLKSP